MRASEHSIPRLVIQIGAGAPTGIAPHAILFSACFDALYIAYRRSSLDPMFGSNGSQAAIILMRSVMVDDPSKLTYSHGLLGLAQAWLPVLTVVGGALWGLFTYLDHAKEAAKTQAASEQNLAIERKSQSEQESRTRLIEVQKPFLDKQLALYLEASQVVGRLVAKDLYDPTNPPEDVWKVDLDRFEELYWSELTMVEHTEVATAMVGFRTTLQPVLEKRSKIMTEPRQTLDERNKMNEEINTIDRNGLRDSALVLAHALRRGIEESWGNSAGSTNTIVAPYQK
jgi:hypothetical protein